MVAEGWERAAYWGGPYCQLHSPYPMSSLWTVLTQSSGCPRCSKGSAEKPSCSYRTSQPFPLIEAPTSKKATKGVLCLQAKAAASWGHPLTFPVEATASKSKPREPGAWLGTSSWGWLSPSPVLLSWPGWQNPPFPISPSQQHLASHLCHTAVCWELHIDGYIAIQIQVNISLYE